MAKGFRDRITGKSGVGLSFTQGPPEKTELTKHYVGSDHAPTEEEALEMGRALYDSIVTEIAKKAREED